MFRLRHTMTVNDLGAEPCSPALTRHQLWQGLVLKAENPVPFLDGMTACKIVDRGHDWLVRDVTLRGENMQERVVFEPQKRIVFERTQGSAMGRVINEIIEGHDGELVLAFSFDLEVEGLAHGSPEEAAYAERMSQSYFQGVGSTLAEIRRRVTSGLLSPD